MQISLAVVSTDKATSYMKQLCRHWAHRFPVTFDDQQGRIELPSAVCLLQAAPAHLKITLELAEDADRLRMQQVVEEHLQRFGFREALIFTWTPASQAANLRTC